MPHVPIVPTDKPKRCIIYARCSTDEAHQDVEVQLIELRRYCQAYGWVFDEVSEYGSGYKGNQPKLEEVIEKIRTKQYDIMLVYSMDRFSRQAPNKTNALLDIIVYQYKCRFIAIQQSIDSDNGLIWNVVRPLFTYFANVFSQALSEKVKGGIKRKKDLGKYEGGRPKKNINLELLKQLYAKTKSFRKTADEYNQTEPIKISYVTVKKTLDKSSEGKGSENTMLT